MIVILAAIATLAAAPFDAPPEVAATLRAKDQALLDAIAPGDRASWDRALTPDAIYVDENGMILDRAEFLKELTGLSPGTSGHISITDYRVRLHGAVALVVMRMDEREDYHGKPLHAAYLMTETWLRAGGDWRLAQAQSHVMAMDPPAIAQPAAVLDGYVGRYSLTPEITYVIRREGDHLVGGRQGGPAMKPVLVELPDLLFTPGQPRDRKLMQRGPDGRVTGFIERREGEDLFWTRLAP